MVRRWILVPLITSAIASSGGKYFETALELDVACLAPWSGDDDYIEKLLEGFVRCPEMGKMNFLRICSRSRWSTQKRLDEGNQTARRRYIKCKRQAIEAAVPAKRAYIEKNFPPFLPTFTMDCRCGCKDDTWFTEPEVCWGEELTRAQWTAPVPEPEYVSSMEELPE